MRAGRSGRVTSFSRRMMASTSLEPLFVMGENRVADELLFFELADDVAVVRAR